MYQTIDGFGGSMSKFICARVGAAYELFQFVADASALLLSSLKVSLDELTVRVFVPTILYAVYQL